MTAPKCLLTLYSSSSQSHNSHKKKLYLSLAHTIQQRQTFTEKNKPLFNQHSPVAEVRDTVEDCKVVVAEPSLLVAAAAVEIENELALVMKIRSVDRFHLHRRHSLAERLVPDPRDMDRRDLDSDSDIDVVVVEHFAAIAEVRAVIVIAN